MLKQHRIITLSVLIFFIFGIKGIAQNSISSPYSGFGVGVLSNSMSRSLSAIGGTSYAMQNSMLINFKNPASYIAFDSLSVLADASFSIINARLRVTDNSQRATYARFDYLMLGLPIIKHWRMSAGILPFSDVGYRIKDDQEDILYSYDGDGGLMQLYWGNSFRLAKGLSLGLNISYLFGSLNNIRYAEFKGDYFLNSRIEQSLYVDGIYLTGGIQYFFDIKNNHHFGVGVVYENSAYIWVKENLFIGNYTGTYNPNNSLDTVQYSQGEKGRMIIPQSIGGGISYSFKESLLAGVDVTWKNWAKYENMGKGDSLKNAFTTSVGIQYTPDPKSTKYFNKITYRLGGRYSSGYMKFRGVSIPEYSISFGIGLPLRSFSSQSSINIMFEYGQMGTIQKDLILENYFKLSFSFILQEKWYQRVKLE